MDGRLESLQPFVHQAAAHTERSPQDSAREAKYTDIERRIKEISLNKKSVELKLSLKIKDMQDQLRKNRIIK
jgi:hypothetical protein